MHTNQLVASQPWVTTALGSYALSSALGSYVPTSRTITINGTAYDLSANREWNITSMIYPAVGIALSTGSAWGTSITNNSSNWNTAYGWGNHASAGYLTGITSTQVTTALGYTPYNSTNPAGYITGISFANVSAKPTTLSGYGITDAVPSARTITINGTALDLSANRSFTVTASETDTLATVTARGASTSTALSLSGRVTFGSAIADRPQIPGGMLGLDTGDGNFDIWGISRDYYPSNPSTANAWGLRWNGNNNDFEFVGAGTSRVILDMDSGNVTATGTISASNLSGTNTGDQTNISGNAATVTNGVYTNAGQNNLSGILNFGSSGAVPYNSPTGTSNGISFGGVESSSLRTYGIFTEQENIGGNYSKLTINYHTGIRIGAMTSYGGTRFYNNFAGGSGGGSEIFSVGNGDSNVRATNTIYAAGYRGNANVAGTGEAIYAPAGVYSTGTNWLYGTMYLNGNTVNDASYLGLIGTNNTPIVITGAAHKYLTINPGNGYEAMVRYIGGTGSGWYVGKRTSGQLVGTQSFHFYSEEAGATVGGIDPGGSMFAVGSMRSPIFYDSNDTGYYLDPNGESSLWRFTAQTMTRNAINYLSINSPVNTRAAQAGPYLNGTMGWGNTDFNTVFSNWGSGFIDTWSNPANAPGGSSHYVGLQGCHYNHQNSSNVYGFQMACAGEASNRYFWRNAWPGMQSWVEMVHSGNILSFSTSGNSANTIVRRDGSGDIAIGTLNTNHAYFGTGGRGLTSADSYGSYGNVHTYGTGMNGYYGYGAYDNSGYRSFLMWNSGNGGIYMQDRGKWQTYYFGGNDCTGITGSETYDWVRACTNGKHRITNDSWCDATSWAYTFSNISDGRLKENIITVDSALDKVLQLRGVYYNWIIDTENTKHIGLIAQETAEVCPEVVNYHDETDTYSVNYSELSGLFVESTKELNQKLIDANARIELLETKLNQLLNA
jgi:hypothetical protein